DRTWTSVRSSQCARLTERQSSSWRGMATVCGRVAESAEGAGSERPSGAGRPDGEEGIAEMVGGRSAAHCGRAVRPGLAEVLGDDAASVIVGRVQPAPDGLGREQTVAERADEPSAWSDDAGHVSEHLDGPGEVVDGDTAHRVVDAPIGQ